jgi:hypothetical protein
LTDEYIIDDILKDGCKMNDLLKDTLEEARLANTSDMPVGNCAALSSPWFCKRSNAWITTGY